MQLERPLLALALALAALVLLAILERMRRQPVVLLVASLDLFPESAEVANAAAQSRRREWRDLLLRALAAVAFALAAGGPSVEAGEPSGRRVRVLLARGASLAAREPVGRSRLDLARDEVRRALERLAPEDRVDLGLLPPGLDAPEAGLSPAAAIRALDSVAAVAAPGDLASNAAPLAAAASDLARDPAHALPALAVVDRAPAPGSLPAELLAAARLATVGSPLGNRALVALGSRRDETGRERLLGAVANLAPTSAKVEVELRLARDPGELARAAARPFSLELAAGETRSFLFDDAAVLAAATVAEARLVGEDALALDDRVLALRPALVPVRIAIAGDLGRPVETALRACEGVSVELFPEGQAPSRGFDLTVLRAERDDEPAPLGACVFVCPPTQGALEPRGLRVAEARARTLCPSVLGGESAGGLDLAAALARVGRVRPEPPRNLGALEPVLVASEPVPTTLIAASPAARAGALAVYLGFDTRAAGVVDVWARDASFPRFWAEIVERVRERPEEPPGLSVEPTGRALALPRPADASPGAWLEVVPPGEPPRAHRARGGRWVPLEAGLHRVRAEQARGEALFAAALLDPATSDLRQAAARPFDDATLARLAERGGERARASLAGLASVLGLALAAAAWVLAGWRPAGGRAV